MRLPFRAQNRAADALRDRMDAPASPLAEANRRSHARHRTVRNLHRRDRAAGRDDDTQARDNARAKLGVTLARGTIVKEPCLVCGGRTNVTAYIANPALWREVLWVCREHRRDEIAKRTRPPTPPSGGGAGARRPSVPSPPSLRPNVPACMPSRPEAPPASWCGPKRPSSSSGSSKRTRRSALRTLELHPAGDRLQHVIAQLVRIEAPQNLEALGRPLAPVPRRLPS